MAVYLKKNSSYYKILFYSYMKHYKLNCYSIKKQKYRFSFIIVKYFSN